MTAEERNAMWDCRDRFVAELRGDSLLPERTLYIQRQDGGACAIGSLPNGTGALAIDWHTDTCSFAVVNQPQLLIGSYEQEADGFGGMFGFGEKGGSGWLLRLLDGDALLWEAPLLPGITAIADLLYSEDRLLNGKRKKRDVPLWQLRPENAQTCEQILSVWEKLLNTKTAK